LDQLTSHQIGEWEAYDKLDPIGAWRNELGFAKIESLLINIVNSLYHKEGTEVVTTSPVDFMIQWGEEIGKTEPKKQSIEEMKEVFKAIKQANDSAKKVGVKPPKKKPDKYQGR
jgi:hypothetical protein